MDPNREEPTHEECRNCDSFGETGERISPDGVIEPAVCDVCEGRREVEI